MTSEVKASKNSQFIYSVNNDKLAENWQIVSPKPVDKIIVNIADNSFPKQDPALVNRYGFLINRFRSIHITLVKEFSFTLEEFITNPEIRLKAVKTIQRLLQKKIERTWHAFLKEANNVKENVASKSIPTHITILSGLLKLISLPGEFTEQDFVKPLGFAEDLLSFVIKVSKLPLKIKEFHNQIISFNPSDPIKAFKLRFKSFNVLVEIAHDLGSAGSTVIKTLENTYLKTAYEALGLGENFIPISSDVLEFFEFIDGPLIAVRIYLKVVNLCENIEAFTSAKTSCDNNKNNSTEELQTDLNKARIKLICSSLDMAKEIAKISVFALSTLGLIPVPIFVTVIISGIGIVTFSIKLYTYFAHKDEKKTEDPITIGQINKNNKSLKRKNEIESHKNESSDDESEPNSKVLRTA